MTTTRLEVVTGASRGIGRAIALRLARAGAAVVVNSAGGVGSQRHHGQRGFLG